MKEREREKENNISSSLFLLSPQKAKATPAPEEEETLLAHGSHGGACQSRPRHLPGVADGHERARQERRDAAKDREGGDGEGLRRGAEGGGVRLFFWGSCSRGGGEQRQEDERGFVG